MILINKYVKNHVQASTLAEARAIRDLVETVTDYNGLSFWYYSSNGKEKEICIDSFNSDAELTDENIFTENEFEAEFFVFDFHTGERKNLIGEKYADKLKEKKDKEIIIEQPAGPVE